MKKLRNLMLMAILVLALTSVVGCSSKKDSDTNTGTKTETKKEDKKDSKKETKNKKEETKLPKEIILATTTSTQDSGLLDYLLPKFTEKTGIEVKTIAVGTGKALEMGEKGEADVLLVHAKDDEKTFVKKKYGTEREEVMYNDFILVGPKTDPLKLGEESKEDIKSALKNIGNSTSLFISRGDDSGTHKVELKLWEEVGIKPEGDWYISTGSGMGDVLKMASEKQGYTLTDRATYLSMKDTLDLDILVEKDDLLYNQYGVIPVNPEKHKNMSDKNLNGAKAFADWLVSKDVQTLIKDYGLEEYGQSLFIPNAK